METFSWSLVHRWPVDSPHKYQLRCFLWFVPEQTVEQTIESPVIWVTIAYDVTVMGMLRVDIVLLMDAFSLFFTITKCIFLCKMVCMMTSSNGNNFRITGLSCEEFTGEFPTQRPVTRSFDVFFDLTIKFPTGLPSHTASYTRVKPAFYLSVVG